MPGSGRARIQFNRDHAIILAALTVITVLAWLYIIELAARMDAAMPAMNMSTMPGMGAAVSSPVLPWSFESSLLMFAMWVVMMVGMMTPSVAPMVLIYAQVARVARKRGTPFAPSGWFISGYLLAWTGFALVATISQWALAQAAMLTPMMAGASRTFGGIVLVAAGLFQWTPLKNACLSQCRAPLSFVQHHGGFRPDATGSLRLGLLHGLYCMGCCWALMALLFVGGVMNLLWIAAIMIFVLLEKLLPGAFLFSRIGGLVMCAAGGYLLVVRF